MSFYRTCTNCGKPECMDPDNGVHVLDDGRFCQDKRDAEIESLRAELHRITQEPDVRRRGRAEAISHALGIEDCSTTKQLAEIARLRKELEEARAAVMRAVDAQIALEKEVTALKATNVSLHQRYRDACEGLDQVARLREALSLKRRFPIQGGPSVLWFAIAPHEAQAKRNHCGQTLQRLAEQGGLDPVEALAVVEDREFPRDRSVFDEHRARWAEFVRKTDAEMIRMAALPENAEERIAKALADASEAPMVTGWQRECARAIVKALREVK